ncbi:TetR/AcrR family transcriptional regulator [Streptomyces zhihengii]
MATNWREKRRASAVAEIKDVAKELLVKGGPGAVSLRAISREMGMTPSALYRYYPSLEALLADVRSDLFQELGAVTTLARDGVAGAIRCPACWRWHAPSGTGGWSTAPSSG